MYDLCSRPEQPEPALDPTDMGSREAIEHHQREPKKWGDDQHRGISGGDDAAAARNASPSLLGKRHQSLYADLNGFEVGEKHKVSANQCLLVGDNIVQVKKN